MKKTMFFIFLFCLIFYMGYRNFFSQGNVSGHYINNATGQSSIVEVPVALDTLLLSKDGKFENSFWGKGTYKLSYTLKGTMISFYFDGRYGKGRFKTRIYRPLFGNAKIILDDDLGYYYELLK